MPAAEEGLTHVAREIFVQRGAAVFILRVPGAVLYFIQAGRFVEGEDVHVLIFDRVLEKLIASQVSLGQQIFVIREWRRPNSLSVL